MGISPSKVADGLAGLWQTQHKNYGYRPSKQSQLRTTTGTDRQPVAHVDCAGDCCVERLPRSHLRESRASGTGDEPQPLVSAHNCIRVRLPGAGNAGRLVTRQLAANHFWTAMAGRWTSISGLRERTGVVVCGHRCGVDFGWTQRAARRLNFCFRRRRLR